MNLTRDSFPRPLHGHAVRPAARRPLPRIRPLEKQVDRFPRYRWHGGGETREVVVWSTNDYLGMGRHPVVLAAAEATLRSYGAGAGGTRNISGTSPLHAALEGNSRRCTPSRRRCCSAAATSPTRRRCRRCLSALPGFHVFSDAKNHASMIAGMRSAPRRQRHIFRHNDMAIWNSAARRPRRRAEADRLRERLFDGRRHRRHRRDLRPRRPLRRDDLYRRGACRRHVRRRGRRHRPARRGRATASTSSRARSPRGSACSAATSPATTG